jgi:hypothetical protein
VQATLLLWHNEKALPGYLRQKNNKPKIPQHNSNYDLLPTACQHPGTGGRPLQEKIIGRKGKVMKIL